MKKILNHTILAFIFTTQSIFLIGCTQHVKVFECKVKCEETTLECKTAVSGSEIDLN